MSEFSSINAPSAVAFYQRILDRVRRAKAAGCASVEISLEEMLQLRRAVAASRTGAPQDLLGRIDTIEDVKLVVRGPWHSGK